MLITTKYFTKLIGNGVKNCNNCFSFAGTLAMFLSLLLLQYTYSYYRFLYCIRLPFFVKLCVVAIEKDIFLLFFLLFLSLYCSYASSCFSFCYLAHCIDIIICCAVAGYIKQNTLCCTYQQRMLWQLPLQTLLNWCWVSLWLEYCLALIAFNGKAKTKSCFLIYNIVRTHKQMLFKFKMYTQWTGESMRTCMKKMRAIF